MQDRLKRALLPVSKVWSYVSYTWCDNHGIYAHNSLFGSIHIVRCPRGSLIRRSTVKTGTNPNRNPDPNRPTTQAIFVSLVLLALIVRVVFEVAEPSGNWADTVRSVLPVLAYINAAVNNVNEYNTTWRSRCHSHATLHSEWASDWSRHAHCDTTSLRPTQWYRYHMDAVGLSLLHDLLLSPISQHSVWSELTCLDAWQCT